MRVLKWIIDRVENTTPGQEHFFGISPDFNELQWTGLNFTAEQFEVVTGMDKAAWKEELALHDALFEQLNLRLPQVLLDTRKQMAEKLAA